MIVWDDTPLQSHWATEIPLVRLAMSCAQSSPHSEGGGEISSHTVGLTPLTRGRRGGGGGGGGGGGDGDGGGGL